MPCSEVVHGRVVDEIVNDVLLLVGIYLVCHMVLLVESLTQT